MEDLHIGEEFKSLLQISDYLEPEKFLSVLKEFAQRNDVIIDEKQDKFTEKHLKPLIPSIKKFFKYLRELYDEQIRELQKKHKPDRKKKTPFSATLDNYPIGYCFSITDSILKSVERMGLENILGNVFDVDNLILKRIYIILDDKYFQNAIQMGTLYIDVANDTVDVKKEKVVVKHLKDVNYKNFGDFEHFAIVAERYLNVKLYPNKDFPEVFDIFPLIVYSESHGYNFFDYNATMFFKNVASNFELSEKFKKSEFYLNRNLPEDGKKFLKQYIEKYDFPFRLKNLFNQVKFITNNNQFKEQLMIIADYIAKLQELPKEIYENV